MSEEITPEIKKAIENITYQKDGETYIDLKCARLDFSFTYKLEKFTKKGVKLSWMNGREKVNVVGKVDFYCNEYQLYTEAHMYGRRLTIKEE